MMKNRGINGTEEIGLVTPTPEEHDFKYEWITNFFLDNVRPGFVELYQIKHAEDYWCSLSSVLHVSIKVDSKLYIANS